MSGQQKKYVYRELVQGTKDPIRMIAYAIYKSHKDGLAAQFEQQHGSAQVPQKLQDWHDTVALDSIQLEGYMTTAMTFVSVMKGEIEAEVRQAIAAEHSAAITSLSATHQQQITDMNTKLGKADERARDDWVRKMDQWSVAQTTPPKWRRLLVGFFVWLGGGISGLLATALTTAILVGIASWVSPTIRVTANSVLKGTIDQLLPDKPVDLKEDSYNANKTNPVQAEVPKKP